MPTTRITQRTVSTTLMHGLQSNLGRMQKLQEQLSSGKQVSRPSDSPVQTVEAMQFRAGIRRTEQYVRNADDGMALLGTADAALTEALAMTRRVRELALGGMNATVATDGRNAIAAELRTLRESLLGVANTRYLDRPVFGGNTLGSSAFDPATGAYVGDDGSIARTIGPGAQVVVSIPGTSAFGADGDPAQLFDLVDRLADALETGGPAMAAALDGGLVDLDRSIESMINALGQVGARYNRVEAARNAAEGQLLSLTSSLSEAEDIDLPKTIVDLQMQEVAYKAALNATARVVQPSLLDFLR